MLDHVRVRNVLRADAHFHRHGEVVHQGFQLLQQVLAERGRVGDGDTVGPGQLHLGVGTRGLRDFALAMVGQTQFRVTKQCTLLGIGFDAILEVALERLVQRRSGSLVQSGKTVHGLFSGFDDNKRFGHDQLPVF
ncbi:hypothetical protein D3C78_1175170 [compost metagenome]